MIIHRLREVVMRKWGLIFTLTGLIALPALADAAFPDLRGAWKGDSESIFMGTGNSHHPGSPNTPPQLHSATFTMKIDMQNGRRFSGTFASPRATETIIGVISRAGSIFIADDDGDTIATVLAPNRLELCYLNAPGTGRVASCTEFVKQP
jgi:hypothetical protein